MAGPEIGQLAVRVVHFDDAPPQPVTDQPAADRCVGTPPRRTTWERYAAMDGALSVGEWASEPGAWRIRFHPQRHEFFHVLSGRIRITATSGEVREFGPGDAAVIPAGFEGVFEVLEPVRKYYVMIDPPTGA